MNNFEQLLQEILGETKESKENAQKYLDKKENEKDDRDYDDRMRKVDKGRSRKKAMDNIKGKIKKGVDNIKTARVKVKWTRDHE